MDHSVSIPTRFRWEGCSGVLIFSAIVCLILHGCSPDKTNEYQKPDTSKQSVDDISVDKPSGGTQTKARPDGTCPKPVKHFGFSMRLFELDQGAPLAAWELTCDSATEAVASHPSHEEIETLLDLAPLSLTHCSDVATGSSRKLRFRLEAKLERACLFIEPSDDVRADVGRLETVVLSEFTELNAKSTDPHVIEARAELFAEAETLLARIAGTFNRIFSSKVKAMLFALDIELVEFFRTKRHRATDNPLRRRLSNDTEQVKRLWVLHASFQTRVIADVGDLLGQAAGTQMKKLLSDNPLMSVAAACTEGMFSDIFEAPNNLRNALNRAVFHTAKYIPAAARVLTVLKKVDVDGSAVAEEMNAVESATPALATEMPSSANYEDQKESKRSAADRSADDPSGKDVSTEIANRTTFDRSTDDPSVKDMSTEVANRTISYRSPHDPGKDVSTEVANPVTSDLATDAPFGEELVTVVAGPATSDISANAPSMQSSTDGRQETPGTDNPPVVSIEPVPIPPITSPTTSNGRRPSASRNSVGREVDGERTGVEPRSNRSRNSLEYHGRLDSRPGREADRESTDVEPRSNRSRNSLEYHGRLDFRRRSGRTEHMQV